MAIEVLGVAVLCGGLLYAWLTEAIPGAWLAALASMAASYGIVYGYLDFHFDDPLMRYGLGVALSLLGLGLCRVAIDEQRDRDSRAAGHRQQKF